MKIYHFDFSNTSDYNNFAQTVRVKAFILLLQLRQYFTTTYLRRQNYSFGKDIL